MKKISIIEDNPDNMLLVHVLLEGKYELKEYENGFDGLEGMKENIPDLILLDISLPGMDGIEVLKNIRADDHLRDLPVIAFTAHAMVGDREKYLAIGFDGYLTKPVLDEEQLFKVIEDQFSNDI